MPYISVQDFFEKTAGKTVITREEERRLADAMARGDSAARGCLIAGYLPMVAGHIRHCKTHLQTLNLVYACLQTLENAVDSFDFMQESEPFSHRLSWYLRQTTVRYIAQQRNLDA